MTRVFVCITVSYLLKKFGVCGDDDGDGGKGRGDTQGRHEVIHGHGIRSFASIFVGARARLPRGPFMQTSRVAPPACAPGNRIASVEKTGGTVWDTDEGDDD